MSYWKVLTYRKTFPEKSSTYKPSNIIGINRLDITLSLSIGAFIVIGFIIRNIAGPSVIVSLIVAAIFALLCGLFYADIGTRFQRSVSAYECSYYCIGEWAAFLVGWHMILECTIGIAAISKTIGYYIDGLLDDLIKLELGEVFPINWQIGSNYFDWVGFVIPLIFGLLILINWKRYTIIDRIFMLLVVGVILFIIIAGSFKGTTANWSQIPESEINPIYSPFYPFGVSGVIQGAAHSIIIFIGLDFVSHATGQLSAITGIILFIIASLFLISISVVLSLLLPYYSLNEYAPLPQGFNEIDWHTAHWIISIGGILALFVSVFGYLLPLQRALNTMAWDGLIFRIFGNDTSSLSTGKSTTPFWGTIATLLLSSIFAAVFTVGQLVELLSIGTLFAFLMVSVSIIMSRFENSINENGSISTIDVAETKQHVENGEKHRMAFVKKVSVALNCGHDKKPTRVSYSMVKILIVLFCVISLALVLVIRIAINDVEQIEIWAIATVTVLAVLLILIVILMSVQPMRNQGFKILLVPILPIFSIFLNIVLMVWSSPYALIRLGIWTILGIPIYILCIIRYQRTKIKENSSSKPTYFKGVINKGFLDEPEMQERTSITGSLTPTYMDSVQEFSSISVPEGSKEEKDIIENEQLSNEVNTKNPSPSTSYDDILLCSDIVGSLTEKKEPNGKTYFIDEGKQEKVDIQENNQEEYVEDLESTTAIALLDDILNTEENSLEKSNEDFDRALKGSPVTAVIHLQTTSEEHTKEKIDKEETGSVKNQNISSFEQESEMIVEIPTPDYNDTLIPPSTDYQLENERKYSNLSMRSCEYIKESTPTDSEDSFKSAQEEIHATDGTSSDIKQSLEKSTDIDQLESDLVNTSIEEKLEENVMSFKDHLTMLLRQPSKYENSKKTIVQLKNENDNEDQPYTRLTHARSEPDIMKLVLEDIRSKRSDLFDKDNMDNDQASPIKIPRVQLSTETVIPPAPKFDPDVYKTLGSRVHHRKTPIRPILTNTMSIDSGQSQLRNKEKPSPLPMPDSAEIDENLDPKSRIDILKNKLENILKKGPPIRISKIPSVPSSPVISEMSATGVEDNEKKNDENESKLINFKEANKPFDTVHKQKILFDDVLKCIGSETRPSLLRATSPKRETNSTVF